MVNYFKAEAPSKVASVGGGIIKLNALVSTRMLMYN